MVSWKMNMMIGILPVCFSLSCPLCLVYMYPKKIVPDPDIGLKQLNWDSQTNAGLSRGIQPKTRDAIAVETAICTSWGKKNIRATWVVSQKCQQCWSLYTCAISYTILHNHWQYHMHIFTIWVFSIVPHFAYVCPCVAQCETMFYVFSRKPIAWKRRRLSGEDCNG